MLSDFFVLIFCLISFLCPQTERVQCLSTQQWHDGHSALAQRALQLLIDKVVGKLDITGILAGVAIEYLTDTGPIDSANTSDMVRTMCKWYIPRGRRCEVFCTPHE